MSYTATDHDTSTVAQSTRTVQKRGEEETYDTTEIASLRSHPPTETRVTSKPRKPAAGTVTTPEAIEDTYHILLQCPASTNLRERYRYALLATFDADERDPHMTMQQMANTWPRCFQCCGIAPDLDYSWSRDDPDGVGKCSRPTASTCGRPSTPRTSRHRVHQSYLLLLRSSGEMVTSVLGAMELVRIKLNFGDAELVGPSSMVLATRGTTAALSKDVCRPLTGRSSKGLSLLPNGTRGAVCRWT